eukprot:1151943-Pelagomonas_calceolata.AAC.4
MFELFSSFLRGLITCSQQGAAALSCGWSDNQYSPMTVTTKIVTIALQNACMQGSFSETLASLLVRAPFITMRGLFGRRNLLCFSPILQGSCTTAPNRTVSEQPPTHISINVDLQLLKLVVREASIHCGLRNESNMPACVYTTWWHRYTMACATSQ